MPGCLSALLGALPRPTQSASTSVQLRSALGEVATVGPQTLTYCKGFGWRSSQTN